MPSSEIHPLDLAATDLSRKIHLSDISCVEVMQAALERIASVNPAHNALVSLRTPEELLREAQGLDNELAAGTSRGWLHGMPLAIKDLSQAKGLPCTWGSLIYKDHVSEQDDPHVARIRAAGAILIGKTNTPEMGLGSHTTNKVFGPARNAFDTSRSAGGSSGGAAVALSLGLVPVADGSDMMGSLRNPAAFNGIYGFRPSYGRIASPGSADLYFSQLASTGSMGRTVRDMAALYETMAGYDGFDPLALDDELPASDFQPSLGDGVTIGWMGDLGGYLPMENGVLETCSCSLEIMRGMGCAVEDVVPDFDFADLWFSWTTLRSFSTHFNLGPLSADPEKRQLLGAQALWEVENRSKLSVDDLERATRIRSRWFEYLARLYEKFDYLVLPSAQVFAFDVDTAWPTEIAGRTMDTYHRWMEVVIGPSLAGLPVAALPSGLGSNGLPHGVQLIGKARSDRSTLAFAAAYERAILAAGVPGVQGKVPLSGGAR
ncbi:amidase [Roseibium sp. CAU 1637]|uniref:Amidase n=1 Tax=Roseibium limicola TaxID=2816037 RepID=A0A939ERR4_9HYPH|nr:amidase [Roseibium limicola]MBO0346892.1 amidase [Roseibium limicola]